MHKSAILGFFFFIFLSAGFLLGQQVTGTISGRVTDTSGAVIAGATVQVENVETGFSRSVQTDSAGRYEARNLPPGSYSVTAQQSGFRTEVRRGIMLTVASELSVNLELSVGEVQEKVEVTAEAPAIETTNATLSGLINQAQMRDLPLNGRSFDQLELLASGVVWQPNQSRTETNGNGLRISASGDRSDANLYLLDGTMVNDHTSQGPGSAAGLSLGIDAIREFRVLTHNYSAEYGGKSGAVVSAITRSGTNEFHGGAYEFLRNNIFDARNFFNPGALPPFRQNQFGVSLGGPVKKDRIFFFFNYEGFRQRQGTTTIVNVPNLAARQGLLPNSTTGVLQPTTVNPAALPYVDLYPLPNGRDFGNGIAQFKWNFSEPANEDYAMERMDFRLSDQDSFYWRYVRDPSSIVVPGNEPPFIQPTNNTNNFVVLSETHIFSAAGLNEFRFAFNRTAPSIATEPLDLNHALDFGPGLGIGTISFTTAPAGQGQLTQLGTTAAQPQFFPQNVFQVSDAFSYVKGPHTLKFGLDMERFQLGNQSLNSQRGNYAFPSLASLLAGTPSQLTLAVVGGTSSPNRGWRQILFGWFVQDDFRIRPNLTLNLGFRHEFQVTPSEVEGKSANLINTTDLASTVGPPLIPDKKNFAPRVGLAWDPFGKGKTSIRLGVGMFYNELTGRTWYLSSMQEYRFLTTYLVRNPTSFPNAFGNALTPGSLSEQTMQYNTSTPTAIHYNLDVQQQLAPTLSVHAGYVGSDSYNLTEQDSEDIRVAQILPDGSRFFAANAPFVNPNFSTIRRLRTRSIGKYNAMQAGLTKSLSRGLLLQVNYTWSKNLATADALSSSQLYSINAYVMDVANLNRDYGYAAFDQRHSFVANARYKLPFGFKSGLTKAVLGGWEMNAILIRNSGLPLAVLDGFNNSQNGDSGQPDRPNLLPGFSNNPTHGTTAGCQGVPGGQKLGTPDLWFDPCAFGLSPAGTFGNLGRDTVIGPPFRNLDFSMGKNFPLRERFNVEFRAEFFNILNHANFSAPLNPLFTAQRVSSGNAGVIVSTANANREIQFGLKMTF